jgi:hypothetical protein
MGHHIVGMSSKFHGAFMWIVELVYMFKQSHMCLVCSYFLVCLVLPRKKWKPQTFKSAGVRWNLSFLSNYVFLGKTMFFLHLSTFFIFTISWKPGSGSPRKYTLDRLQLVGDFSPASNDWYPSCWAVGTWSSRQGRMAQTSPNSAVSATVKHQNVFPSWWLGGSVGSESLRDLPKVTEIAKQVSTDANTIKKSNLKQFDPKIIFVQSKTPQKHHGSRIPKTTISTTRTTTSSPAP